MYGVSGGLDPPAWSLLWQHLTVPQDKDNFGRAEIRLFSPLWLAFYDTFPVVSFFLLNVVLIYPKILKFRFSADSHTFVLKRNCPDTPHFWGTVWPSIDLSNLTVVGLYTRNGFVTTVIKEIYKSLKGQHECFCC